MEKIRLSVISFRRFSEMKEKNRNFIRESVKNYLLAFLMEAARLNDEDSLLPGEELPVVGKQIWKEEITQVEAALRYVEEHYAEQLRAGGSGNGLRPQRGIFANFSAKNMQLTPMEMSIKYESGRPARLMNGTASSLERSP